ncbi:glycosyl hydrolase, partial [Flavobacterium bomense]
ALIGALANDKNSPLGSWRLAADDNSAVSVLEAMQQYKENKLTYEKGADLTIEKATFLNELVFNTTDRSGFDAAKKVAANADVVVMVLGENGFQTGEARSRTNLDLPGLQQELLEEIYKVNPNIVLVLNNGRPLALPWAAKNIPAIVEAWQLGTQAGNAVAQVLYGDYNPSGKLPMSFPRNVGQCPIYYNNYSTGRPNMTDNNVFWSHYTDVEKTPQFPFGFGLSYTTFEYSNMKISSDKIKFIEKLKVSVDVKNTGNYDGQEIVQLYIRDLVGSVTRPVKELKGFEKINLKKGETKTVSFEISSEDLKFYTIEMKNEAEAGNFEVFVGENSNTDRKANFELVH